MANTWLALGVEVMPGNASASLHSMPRIWAWLDALPAAERPALLRGDIAYGNESVLREAEARYQPYLTKLRHGRKFAGAVQPGERLTIPAVGLHPISRFARDE